MELHQAIRLLEVADMLAVKEVIDSCGLFPSELLDGMTVDYFSHQAAGGFWFTYDNGKPIAVAYFIPERMTQGTWNLLLIAVHLDWQGKGYGTAMMRHIEDSLATRGERLLLVETSGLPEFDRTRQFYKKTGYKEEARIRDFYQPGEDKLIFCKALEKDRL